MSHVSNAETEDLGGAPPGRSDEDQSLDLANYRIERLLGRGGMGEVYQAWDLHLHRHVAIKQLHPETMISSAQERLLNEARWTSRLDHPSIVRVLHYDGAQRIIMELVEGRTLAEIVQDRGPLPIQRALEVACQIGEGLVVAHEAGILHRDLKPENVMLTPEGQAKILDFGLAKKVRAPAEEWTGDEDDALDVSAAVGTPRSMSPEQAMGGLALDARSDIFSFGTLIYEITTGECPFLGSHLFATLRKIRNYDPPPMHEVREETPRRLSGLVRRMLQKDPSKRPETTREVLDALNEIREECAPAVGPDAEEPWRARLAAERRQVTLMHYGLSLAPEADEDRPIDDEVRAALPFLNDLAREVVERHNGACHPLGSDLVGCFGERQTREDDARCAVEAGWALLHRFNESLAPRFPRLALRVAVHTDVIVIRRGAADGALWTWDAEQKSEQPWWLPWLATVRIAQLAEPNTLLVSEPTRRLVDGVFEFEFGPELAGPRSEQDAPLSLHRVLGRADQRGDALPTGVLRTLVSRTGELESLERLWNRTRSGSGQVALVAGEAGIGKSRLVWALRERLGLESSSWLMSRCTRTTQHTALRPFIALLWQALGVGRRAGRDESSERLTQTVHGLNLPEDSISLFADLLELPYGFLTVRPPLDDERRRRTIEAAAEFVLALAERRPRVWWIEDIHWADPSTLELLELLLEHCPSLPLMIIVTSRPKHMPRWEARSYLSTLPLPPLNDEEIGELIRRRAGGRDLPEPIEKRIREMTDGVPLYVDELTRWFLQSGAVAPGTVAPGKSGWTLVRTPQETDIPSTLRATLMERLDQLGPAKHVAQIAAVIGREFSEDRLRALVPYEADALRKELDQLVESELLHRRGVLRARYLFKHAFLHLMAYRSLVPEDRRRVHQQLAEALEVRLDEPRGPRPEEVAEHATRAGLLAQAVELWLRAAREAWSPSDAELHLERAEKALERLGPSGDDRIVSWRAQIQELRPKILARKSGQPAEDRISSISPRN